MVAAALLEPFEKEAKERQIRKSESVRENLPQQNSGSKATDKAGKALGVSGRSVRDAKVVREQGNKRISDLWMQCCTQDEIAEECNCSQGEVSKNIPNGNFAEWNKTAVPAADHLTDFDPPIYNGTVSYTVSSLEKPSYKALRAARIVGKE